MEHKSQGLGGGACFQNEGGGLKTWAESVGSNLTPDAAQKVETSVPLAQALPRPQLIFPSKTWFLGIYLNFQRQKSLKHQYLPHSESKSYHINSIKSCSSRSFQQHQRHIPIPPKFSATI